MTPVETAAALYQDGSQPRTFREDLEAHLLNGYVYSTPGLFMMGRAISSLGKLEDIGNPWHAFDRHEQDAWIIWLCAGNMVSVKKHLTDPPYALPQIAWARNGRLRFHQTDNLLKALCRPSYASSSTPSSAPGLAFHLQAVPIFSA